MNRAPALAALAALALAVPPAAGAQTHPATLDTAVMVAVPAGGVTLRVLAPIGSIAPVRAGDVIVAFAHEGCPGMFPARRLLTTPWQRIADCGELKLTIVRGDSLRVVAAHPGSAPPRQRPAAAGVDSAAAQVGGAVLEAEFIAAVMASRRLPAADEVARDLASGWIDEQLFVQTDTSRLADSTMIAAANWPALAQARTARLHDRLVVARLRVAPAAIDSAYAADDARYLLHLLVAADAAPSIRAMRRQLAEQHLARLLTGVEFAELTASVSDDEATRASGGWLGRVTRRNTVQAFEDAAFELPPGAYSRVVETAFGFHILYRPRLELIRDSVEASVRAQLVAQMNTRFLDSLDAGIGITPSDSAAAWMRTLALSPLAAARSTRVLATVHGGTFQDRDAVRWYLAFGPGLLQQVAQAGDSVLAVFLRQLVRNDRLLQTADSLGIQADTAVWNALASGHRTATDSLRAEVTDSLAEPPEVAAGVRLLAGARANLPAVLAWALRQRAGWHWSPGTLARAAALAATAR